MKKYLLAFVIIPALCFAGHANKTYSTPAVYQTLDRSAPWSQFSGAQGFFYVFTPVTASQGVCVYVTNLNNTNARTFTATAYQTGDLSTKAIDDFMNGGGSSEKWVGISLAGGQGSPSFTIPFGDTVSFFVAASGAAHIALQFSLESGTAGGTPDAADIFAVSAPACANGTSSTPNSTNNTLPVQLPNSTWILTSAPAAGSQATVSKAGVSGVRHTAMCYAFDLLATTGTACSGVDAVIRDGACGTGTIIWDELMGATAANGAENHANLCNLQLVGTPGNAMCIEFKSASTSCFQRVNLSGFDQ